MGVKFSFAKVTPLSSFFVSTKCSGLLLHVYLYLCILCSLTQFSIKIPKSRYIILSNIFTTRTLGLSRLHLATLKCSVLDFPYLLPYTLSIKFGNLTTFKILSDALILIWGFSGCNVHDPYIKAKVLFFCLSFLGLLQGKMPFAICVIYSYHFFSW